MYNLAMESNLRSAVSEVDILTILTLSNTCESMRKNKFGETSNSLLKHIVAIHVEEGIQIEVQDMKWIAE